MTREFLALLDSFGGLQGLPKGCSGDEAKLRVSQTHGSPGHSHGNVQRDSHC